MKDKDDNSVKISVIFIIAASADTPNLASDFESLEIPGAIIKVRRQIIDPDVNMATRSDFVNLWLVSKSDGTQSLESVIADIIERLMKTRDMTKLISLCSQCEPVLSCSFTNGHYSPGLRIPSKQIKILNMLQVEIQLDFN